MPRNRRKIAILACGAIAVVCVLAAVLDVTVQVPSIQPFFTANPSGIAFTEVRIPLRDGNSLAGYAVLPAGYDNIPKNSACLTVLSPGVNGRKETMLWKAYNLALHGFIAIAIEARGHGFSTGICTVGIDEPKDISDVITWALTSYQAVNQSRISLYGQSLGGMFSVIAASQDTRVAATVALHPPANFSTILGPFISLADLVRYLPSIQLDEESLRLRSPITWINANGPKNILFIHGDKDTLVPVNQSISLSTKVNASGQNSSVIIRPGLDHPGNEADHESLSLGIAWLNWSLTRGEVPNPEILNTQAASITIFDTPSGSSNFAAELLLGAAAAIFACILLLARRSKPVEELPLKPKITRDVGAKKASIAFFVLIFLVAFILGATNAVPFIWAYLLVLPAIVFTMYVIFEKRLGRGKIEGLDIAGWRDPPRMRNVAVGIGAIVCIAIAYSLVYTMVAQSVSQYGIFILSTAPLFYSSIIWFNFIIDPFVLNAFHWGTPRESWATKFKPSLGYLKKLSREAVGVLAWRFGTVLLCSLFLPEIFIASLPVAINILLIIGLPVLVMAIYILAGLLDLGTKSRTVSLLIVGAIAAMYLQWRLFRLF